MSVSDSSWWEFGNISGAGVFFEKQECRAAMVISRWVFEKKRMYV